MPFEWNTAAGGLTIAGISLTTTWCRVQNLVDLWLPADQRGQDRIVPGSAGVRAQQRRDTVTRRTLRLVIAGDVTYTGSTAGDAFERLAINVDYLRANIVAPTGTTNGTRSAVLTMPDGTTRTEEVHVTGMELGRYAEDARWLLATLELSIPSGRIQ
ncbi:MAG: hypothetical protein ACO307_10635 [Ilumatobacteraceae bacterium]